MNIFFVNFKRQSYNVKVEEFVIMTIIALYIFVIVDMQVLSKTLLKLHSFQLTLVN